MMRSLHLTFIFSVLVRNCKRLSQKPHARRPADQALSAEQSLATIEVPDGYRVELVAAEPLVMDPVAFGLGSGWPTLGLQR